MHGSDQTKDAEAENILGVLALYKLGRIKRGDIGQENQAVLDFYLGLLGEDPKFAVRVRARMSELNSNGRKIPLFAPEVIARMKKKKKRKAKREYAFQLALWPLKLSKVDRNLGRDKVTDPEREIFKTGKKLDSRSFRVRRSTYSEDIRRKNLELREMIGLPIARGKNPHVNDPRYKFLVKRIYTLDVFGIFSEFDRVIIDIPEDLNLKIKKIRKFIDDILHANLSMRQFYKRFNEFSEVYQKLE